MFDLRNSITFVENAFGDCGAYSPYNSIPNHAIPLIVKQECLIYVTQSLLIVRPDLSINFKNSQTGVFDLLNIFSAAFLR